MFAAIRYSLAHLLDFGGRDARQTFWYYVLFVFVVNVAIGLVIVIPFMGQMMTVMMAAVQTGDEAAVQAAMAAQMGEMMESMLWVGAFTTVLNVLLLAASLTRRLHDSNLAGWWGLVPLAAHVGSTWYTTTRIDEIKEMMTQMMVLQATDPQAAMVLQSQMQAQSLAGWIGIIALVILGVRKSTHGPNRYAEAPVRF